jgi:hypothetical protein
MSLWEAIFTECEASIQELLWTECKASILEVLLTQKVRRLHGKHY